MNTINAQDVNGSTVIAKINEKEIKLGHVILTALNLPKNYDDLPNDYIFNLILDQIIKQEIIAQNSKVNELFVTLNVENQERTFKATQEMNRILNGYPSEEKIKSTYELIKTNFSNQKEYNASHILVETKEEAIKLINELSVGENFQELAKKNSIGPSSNNGGSLGWFSAGQMVPEFEAAALMLKINEISNPIKTEFGWHIIKLNDQRLKTVPTLEELKNEITQNLQQEFIENHINEIAQNMKIEILTNDIDPNIIRKEEFIKN
tara:strand:- start:1103 stop:1894 length:792 start_codon:yes stop_codon:yes gene_type:complete